MRLLLVALLLCCGLAGSGLLGRLLLLLLVLLDRSLADGLLKNLQDFLVFDLLVGLVLL